MQLSVRLHGRQNAQNRKKNRFSFKVFLSKRGILKKEHKARRNLQLSLKDYKIKNIPSEKQF